MRRIRFTLKIKSEANGVLSIDWDTFTHSISQAFSRKHAKLYLGWGKIRFLAVFFREEVLKDGLTISACVTAGLFWNVAVQTV